MAKQDLQTKKILIIDADSIFLRLISEKLKAVGLSTKTYVSIENALHFVENHSEQVALIIIDVFLPENEYSHFIESVKGSEVTKYLPIIAIIAKKDQHSQTTMSHVYDQEIEDFIFKPVDAGELVLRCSRLMKLGDTFVSLKDKIQGANKIINILDRKLKDVSSIYNNLEEEYTREKGNFQEKEEYFFSIAHDIKSPLNNVTLGIDLLLENKELVEEDRDLLRGIKDSANRINRMVLEFLHKIKEEKTLEIVKYEWMDPAPILEIILREFYVKANKKDIMITVEVDEEIKTVFWDNSKIFRVISNIVDNAVKYSPEKSTIKISFFQKLKYSEFIIEDEGPGIPDEEKENIFGVFYQPKRSKAGFGIGLAFCKKIVDKHKGRIKIQDKEGMGTKVIVYLPNNPEKSRIA